MHAAIQIVTRNLKFGLVVRFEIMRSSILIVLLSILTILALYSAAAGWTNVELETALQQKAPAGASRPVVYEGIQLASADALDRFRMVEKAKSWFPWIIDLPEPIALMLTALAFGAIGGVIRVTFDAVSNTSQVNGRSFAVVALSSLTGLLILGVSFVVPAALTVSDAKVRPVALLFFCLVGGLFFDQIFAWLRKRIEGMFTIDKSST